MKNINIKKTLYSVSDFVSWQKNGNLVLSPSFQRRPVWKSGAKSFLIDTILRGLPIPIIFIRDRKTDLKNLEPQREVVDGQQRIRTVLSYVDKKLLKDFNPAYDDFAIEKIHNKELANQKFDSLEENARQKILDYEFSVHVLPAEIDDREVLEIFARMNSTGVKLNDQELRNAEYFGEFKTLSYQLASEQLYRWREWKVFTEYDITRMAEVEITSEFIILMIKGLTGKIQSNINAFYKEYDDKFISKNEVAKRFRFVMDQIELGIGQQVHKLAIAKKTLFFSLFAAIYDLNYKIGSDLKPRKPKSLSREKLSMITMIDGKLKNSKVPEKVLEAAAKRTTHLSSRKTIIEYLVSELKNA